MTGKVFKDRMGTGLEKGASYKPGEHPYDLKLVAEIVERCESVLLGEHDGLVDFIMESVPRQLEAIEHFDQDAFLEAIVIGWRQNVDYNCLHFALTHSVRALHSAGINTFNLNLSTVPKQLYVMFPRLKGTEESPITLSCKARVRQFGSRAEYCNLDLEGHVESFAQGAKSSRLRYTGEPAPPAVSGWGAEDSVYYIPSMSMMPFSVGEGYYVYNMKVNSKDIHEFLPLCDRCKFYVERFNENVFEKLRKNGFWNHDNRLYVPDGKDGWNEIVLTDDNWKEVPEE